MTVSSLDKADKTDTNFWEHFEELRKRLFLVLIVFALALITAFLFMNYIMDFLQMPLKIYAIKLYYREPPEKFFTYCKASIACALFFIMPIIAIQTACFVFPALVGKEKRIFLLTMSSGVILFYCGIWLAWQTLVPFSVNFFINFAKNDNIMPLWSISSYTSLVLTLMLVVGLAFELPLALFALIKAGVVEREAIKKRRPAVIVAIFILAAVITPPDAVTQILVGTVIWGLFEITIFVS